MLVGGVMPGGGSAHGILIKETAWEETLGPGMLEVKDSSLATGC